jgi:lipoate-protein ligase A
MRLLDLTLPTAPENLALDEALLEEAEAAAAPLETLRLWEPHQPLVVVGRSSWIEDEVRLDACRELGISVLRRVSGGAAIVTGPGCLMYALVLSCQLRPQLRAIGAAHGWVLDTLAAALKTFVPAVRRQGGSDLAIGERKFSGNSARLRRDHLLYHGTLLYDFPLALIEACLSMPPRMPDYRASRDHHAFLANLPLPRETLRLVFINAFDANQPCDGWPQRRTARIVGEKHPDATFSPHRHKLDPDSIL